LKTHLKGKKLDLAQLGKAIVDAATGTRKRITDHVWSIDEVIALLP